MSLEAEKTACFTGYRPKKLPWGADEASPGCEALKAEIMLGIEKAYARGIRTFISGMAPGCDTFAAEAVMEFRRGHAEAELFCAIPYAGYRGYLKGEERERFDRLVLASDRMAVCSGVYHGGCMMQRNKFMVDNSSLVIAIYDGKPGGTHNTVEYAKKHGREIWLIPPGEQTMI